jgi:hypothetical protein
MLADIHANGHKIDNVTQMINTIGPSNYYIALGSSIDIASDSSINLISSQPVTVTSSDLDMNVNNIQNCGIISGPYCEFNSVYDINIGSQNGPINLTSYSQQINITPGSGMIVQINGDVDVQKYFIHRVQYCVDDEDAANKKYVDEHGLSSLIIGGAGLTWDYLTRTLTLLNPLPAISIPNSTLTTSPIGTPQWVSFSVGSASKPGILTYNGTSFSAAQLTT